MNTTDKTEKGLTFEVSEADYEEGLEKGWTDDDMLKPGVYKVRRASRFRQKPEEKVTISLDGDIVDFFRQRASESYEEEINAELRKLIEQEKLKAA
jgi:uncharacterized protein (DUF4415 family)